jgi:hypothetical protein
MNQINIYEGNGIPDDIPVNEYVNYLKNNYRQPGHPIAFSGIQNIYDYFKGRLKKSDITKALGEIESYTLQREFHSGQRNPSYSHYKRYRFEADLIDVQALSEYNDGITFLFNCIDTWSRYAWVRELRSKHGKVVLEAFKSILDEAVTKPKICVFDRGSEFQNFEFKNYCLANGITLYTPDTSIHGAFIERFNRSFQSIVYSYLAENETNRYISKTMPDGTEVKLLPLFVHSYNNRKHRMIGVTPYQAETMPELEVQIQKKINAYHQKIKPQKPKFEIGDQVRIAKLKGKFSRGYNEQASREIFKIHSIKTNFKIPLYVLSNYRGDEIIKGSFYDFELVKVEGDLFRIEKVIKRRKYRGKNQLFVKWKGFDDSYNSWIDATTTERI